MNCHSGVSQSAVGKATKRIVLIGMPNSGKSTLFNRLTGSSAFVGNWPGLTVDLLQATVQVGKEWVEVVDLPGIYTLNCYSDDERVVQRFLATYPIDLVVLVLNAAQLDRQLRLVLQLQPLGLPSVMLLNMADEAHRLGVSIDVAALSHQLNLPVCLVSAKHGQGFGQASRLIAEALQGRLPATRPVLLPTTFLDEADLQQRMDAILAKSVSLPSNLAITLTNRLDRFLLHPLLGLPLFFLGMLLAFWLIWTVGLPSQDVMGVLTQGLQTWMIEPLMSPFPQWLQSLVIDGAWNGIATVASFLPLIFFFFVMMAVLEDSGYLARSAYLMDALMARLGLDGRSFVLQMMGFGCNVPALMGTRILRSRSLRLLTMLTIPFALCSARLQVFVFIIAAVFPGQGGALALFSLYLMSFGVALVTAALLQRSLPHNEPFVLELPPYRLPTWRHVLVRSWGEVKHFLTRASGFITLGCIAVWTLTNLPPGATGLDTVGGHIGQWLEPVMAPIGIDPYLTLTLIFGFIAKEVVLGSLTVIYGLNATQMGDYLSATMTPAQAYSFCVFCLLYTPCLTTLVTLWAEAKSWRFTAFSVGFSLALAWLASFLVYQGAQLLF